MLLLQHVDGLLGLGVHVLQQLPQLGHLGLAPPVEVGLALASALGLGQPLAQAQDLKMETKGFNGRKGRPIKGMLGQLRAC